MSNLSSDNFFFSFFNVCGALELLVVAYNQMVSGVSPFLVWWSITRSSAHVSHDLRKSSRIPRFRFSIMDFQPRPQWFSILVISEKIGWTQKLYIATYPTYEGGGVQTSRAIDQKIKFVDPLISQPSYHNLLHNLILRMN